MPVAHTGRRRTTAFSSSTWVTVQSLHGFAGAAGGGGGFVSSYTMTAALSKNLCMVYTTEKLSFLVI